ncbi:MAG: methyl coenzyme M reductase system, component A2 [Candidatus Methanofastidiosum sp.]|jgi:methyl coenzyme M reductase system subunit A2|nr:methyl coenzyme M reductase system, component A2 [Methanofastidiosum sp.]
MGIKLSEYLLEVENVSIVFDNKKILDNISFKVKEGESLGLLGKSGSGKSVLINILRGTKEYRPTEGKVYYNVSYCPKCMKVDFPSKKGTPCKKCNEEMILKKVDFWEDTALFNPIRKRTAIMLQRTFSLYGEKTVMENMQDAFSGSETPKNMVIPKIIELLQKVNMVQRMTHIARDLSGGEKQRIVLARQLAINPMLLLADEPTGTLDPLTASTVHNVLLDAVKNGMSLIVTSHWPEAIELLTQRAVWLDAGKVALEGDSKEVVKSFMQKLLPEEKVRYPGIGSGIIELWDVKKYYYSISRGVVKAIDGVTFTVNEKEIFGLVGKSGAGKTTVSRIIAGITPFTEGDLSVRIGDEWIDMKEPGFLGKGKAMLYMGVLHQEYTLYPDKNVLQNLTDSIGIKLPKELGKMKVLSVLEGVGFEDPKELDEILNKMPDALSVGEKHRIALAQVLIKEPRIVILDEPTGTMDPFTRKIVAKSIRRAREVLGETFIIVTHDSDFVVDVCDRACFMKDGKVVYIGEPEEIKERMVSFEESNKQ